MFPANNLALFVLLAIAAAFPTHHCRAQSVGSLVPLTTWAPVFPFTWPLRYSDRIEPVPTPLFASIGEFLRRTREDKHGRNLSSDAAWWSHATRVSYWQYTGDSRGAGSANSEEIRNSLAERRPDLQDGETGEENVIRFIHYRLPWLVTPEAAVHALPTLSLRTGDTLTFELMGGVIGGRSGAYGQLVLRF